MIKEVFFEIVFIKIKSEKNNFNGRFLDILNKESPKFSLFLMNYLKVKDTICYVIFIRVYWIKETLIEGNTKLINFSNNLLYLKNH